MKVAVFSTKPYDQRSLLAAGAGQHEFLFFEARLTRDTAPLCDGARAICAFVNDTLDGPCLEVLHAAGVRFVAMRCAGYNNVDLATAQRLGIGVGRVPAYSPYAVAEHAAALILTLNRKTHRAYNRVREGNFALEGLLGFDLHGKTVGVVGTGKIGVCFARIMLGFGCEVLYYDPFPAPDMALLAAERVDLETLLSRSDVVSLHCPLLPDTRHLINPDTLAAMKRGAMLINTSRGALVDTAAAIEALKQGQLGALGLDVYEEEASLFFEDRSGQVIEDDVFARLQAFPNVVVTGHQAFFTQEALENIAHTTVDNLNEYESSGTCKNGVLS